MVSGNDCGKTDCHARHAPRDGFPHAEREEYRLDCEEYGPLRVLKWLMMALVTAVSVGVEPAWAVEKSPAPPVTDQRPAEALPDAMQGVGITEHLDAPIPKDLAFTDSDGNAVALGQLLDGRRPLILTLNYSNCPMLCSLQLNGLFAALHDMPWDLADKYQMITVSIDPLETTQRATQTKQKYLRAYGRPGAGGGWHVLVGREENIHRLADTVGFGYRYDPVNKQFAHAAVTMICTPDGRLSRYLYGVKYEPQTVRLALLEAAEGKVGSTVEQLLMYCYRYDETAGRYAPAAMKIMKAGGALTVLVLGVLLGTLWIRDRRKSRSGRASGLTPASSVEPGPRNKGLGAGD